MSGLTPFQTVGPFFDVLLRSRVPCRQVTEATCGSRVLIEGVVYDGASNPIVDAFIETWQADAKGKYRHPADQRQGSPDPDFSGYGWSHTDDRGAFRFDTIRPGHVPASEGAMQAPHVLISVMARGILTRYLTRVYFEDEPSNEVDPVLALVPAHRRQTLIARRVGVEAFRFDIKLQGLGETVFFDV